MPEHGRRHLYLEMDVVAEGGGGGAAGVAVGVGSFEALGELFGAVGGASVRMTTVLTRHPAHVQLRALDRREISSRELFDLHLARVDASTVNAVVTRDDAAARAAACAADERRARGENTGLLGGLPLTVKDSFETVGLRTTGGAEELVDRIPDRDADAAARLRHQGAVITGKSNTPAYCQDLHTDSCLRGAVAGLLMT